jgi:hypothetical protein
MRFITKLGECALQMFLIIQSNILLRSLLSNIQTQDTQNTICQLLVYMKHCFLIQET